MESKTIDTKEIKAVEALKENLYNAINDSGLSIVPIYYVVKDIMNEVILIYNSELKKINSSEKEDTNDVSVDE
jgi:hypothetical protein